MLQNVIPVSTKRNHIAVQGSEQNCFSNEKWRLKAIKFINHFSPKWFINFSFILTFNGHQICFV